MKELNANGGGKPPVLIGGEFKFYCLQLKSSVRVLKNLVDR